jgi:putative flippase GtrA
MAEIVRLARFAAVGVLGAGVHIGAFEVVRSATGAAHWFCWIVSFVVAATTGWALNRSFTFRAARTSADAGEWIRYLAVAGVGALAHFAVFTAGIALVPWLARHPALAIVPGSLASLCVTYIGSALFVFASARRNP